MAFFDESSRRGIQNYIESKQYNIHLKPFNIEPNFLLDWKEVGKYIDTLDFSSYTPKSNGVLYIKKIETNGEMAVVEMDALDYIIYYLITAEIVRSLKNTTVFKKNNYSFSNQMVTVFEGLPYELDGYTKFLDASLHRLDFVSPQGAVFLFDISNFGNSIPHRVLSRLLEKYGVQITKEAMHFFAGLSLDGDKGVPYSNICSYIYTELVLNELDQYLIGRGYDFTRYVDDVCIYAYSDEIPKIEKEVEVFLHDVLEMTLSKEKTKIFSINSFREYLDFKKMSSRGGVDFVEFDKLSDTQRALFFEQVFKRAISEKNHNQLGFLLHRARREKYKQIIPLLCEHFEELSALLPSITPYFLSILDSDTRDKFALDFLKIIQSKYFLTDSYANSWCVEIFSHETFLVDERFSIFDSIMRKSDKILYAYKKRNLLYLKQVLKEFKSLNPTEQRSLFLCLDFLPFPERVRWIKGIYKEITDPISIGFLKQSLLKK